MGSRLDANHILRDSPNLLLFPSLSGESGWKPHRLVGGFDSGGEFVVLALKFRVSRVRFFIISNHSFEPGRGCGFCSRCAFSAAAFAAQSTNRRGDPRYD
jgi:hypothetical protein